MSPATGPHGRRAGPPRGRWRAPRARRPRPARPPSGGNAVTRPISSSGTSDALSAAMACPRSRTDGGLRRQTQASRSAARRRTADARAGGPSADGWRTRRLPPGWPSRSTSSASSASSAPSMPGSTRTSPSSPRTHDGVAPHPLALPDPDAVTPPQSSTGRLWQVAQARRKGPGRPGPSLVCVAGYSCCRLRCSSSTS